MWDRLPADDLSGHGQDAHATSAGAANRPETKCTASNDCLTKKRRNVTMAKGVKVIEVNVGVVEKLGGSSAKCDLGGFQDVAQHPVALCERADCVGE